MKNAVLYITDGNYDNVKQLVHSIKSLIKTNNTRNYDIIVLTKTDISTHLSDYNDVIQLIDDFHEVNDIRMHSGVVSSTAALERLFIPLKTEFSEYEKILYLDGDTEIFGDINDVFSIDMGDYEILGRNEGTSHPHLLRSISQCENICPDEKFNRNRNGIYINSGVIVMNLKNITSGENYSDRIHRYLDIYSRTRFFCVVQDIINMFFSIKEMDWSFNAFPNEFNKEGKKIVHYICNDGKILLNSRMMEKYSPNKKERI